jgi:hypothetical protein
MPAPGAAGRAQTTVVPGAAATVRSRAPSAPTAPAPGTGPPPAGTVQTARPPAGGPAAEATAERAAPAARGRHSGARLALIVGLLGAAAIAAGFLIGHAGKAKSPEPLANQATVGDVRLGYPSGWQVGATSTRIPGIAFNNLLVLAPPGGSAALFAGIVTAAGGPTLLSAPFRAAVIGALPAGTPVRIGKLDAYSYSALRVRGLDGTVTLFAVPTSAGVATVACWTSAHGPPGFQRQCASVANTLLLLGVKSYPLGPSASYAGTLATTFKALSSAVRGPLANLHLATTSQAQASAASSLSSAYKRAATDLSATTVSPEAQEANSAIVAALRELEGGYAEAASAATALDSVSYGRAQRRIGSGAAALGAALQGLAKLGYTVG